MRLDKFVSHAAAVSREESHRLIKAKRVTVQGVVAKQFSHAVAESDQVFLDGQQILIAGPRYFMLHKPVGYVCATQDSEHPTVLDLLQEPRKHELHIAGRLDIDTTGLVLISDDGQWSHRVMSPRRECSKCYWVETAEPISTAIIEQFEQGVMLHGEKKPTLPANLRILAANQAELHICEGRYHQVKRMFAAVGNRVVKLHRAEIGQIHLPDSLAAGHYRALTEAEIASF